MKILGSAVSQKRARRSLAMLAATLSLSALAVEARVEAALPPASNSGAPAPVSNAAVRQFMSDAQKALAAGDYRLALILLKNAVSAAPKNGAVRTELGMVLLQMGDAITAERELRQARADGAADRAVLPILFQAMLTRHEEQALLDEFPDSAPGAQGTTAADLLKARALALQSLGRAADATAAINRSLAVRRDVPGLLAAARIAGQQGNSALAKSLSDEALKIDPKNPDALTFRLGLLMLSNDNAGALSLSEQMLQQYPNNLSIRLARIETFLKLKQDDKAKAEVDVILAKSPGAPIGLYYKALLLARANHVKDAWHIAQSLSPEFVQSQPSIAIMISQMAISSGNVETGAAILTAVLSKSPNLLEVRLRLASIRLRQDSPEGALDVLEPIKDNTDPRTLALLSQVYLKLKKYSDAIDVLNKLNASSSAGPSVKRELAIVEMQAGDAYQALKDLIELAAKQPTDPSVVAPLIAALIQVKRFPEALAAADRLGNDPKERAQSLFFRGQILVIQGDPNGALSALQKSLQLDPKNVASLYYRAALYESQMKYAEATRDLHAILTIDPKNVSALIKLAEVAARQNQDKDVRALLAQAISLAPRDPAPRTALIRYLVDRHDLVGALAVGNELVQVLPTNAEGLGMVGSLQLSLGHKTDAISTFRRLATQLPHSAKPQILLANALFVNGDRAGASGALNAAASIDPESGEVRAAQINLFFAQGDVNGAIAAAKSFQTSYPGTSADLLLADTLVRAKQLGQATAILNQSFAAKPNRSVLQRLVQLSIAAGDHKTAQSMMADWLKSNANDVDVRAQYANLIMEDGDSVKAAAQYEIVLSQSPNNIPALNNLGWLLQRSDPPRALSMLAFAYKASPNSPDIADTFGWIKLQQKDTKGALELISRAHNLRPKDGEITYHLVVAIDANGNHNSARGLLKALLNSGVKFDDLAKAQQLAATWH